MARCPVCGGTLYTDTEQRDGVHEECAPENDGGTPLEEDGEPLPLDKIIRYH